MLGDRGAVVTEVKPFDLHGVTYYDLALIFSDGSRLKAGIRRWVMLAANMVVSLEAALARERPALPRLVRCQFE